MYCQSQQLMYGKHRRRYDISETGGWCSDAAKNKHAFDQKLAAALAQLLAGQTVAAFGEGLGLYRKHIIKSGLVKQYDAFDGAPHINNITNGQVDTRPSCAFHTAVKS